MTPGAAALVTAVRVSAMDHTFVVPVYGPAPNLAALLGSLQAQEPTAGNIILTTSTPSPALEDLARHFGVSLRINPQRLDIAADWNFALGSATTDLVTLAHQDDLYEPAYCVRVSALLERHPEAVLGFCDYREHTPGGPRAANLNLRIKRALCQRAFRGRELVSARADKVRLLSLGNPICCPSVMLVRTRLPTFSFPSGYQTNLDWSAWLELAGRPGGFAYLPEALVSKGVHPGSETTATIASRAREREDRMIFEGLWPAPVARSLAWVYKLGYRANRVAPLRSDPG